MLACQGCMRHCLQSIIGDSIFISGSRRIATTSFSSRSLTRSFATRSHGPGSWSAGDSKPLQNQIGDRKAYKEGKLDRKRPNSRKREVTERETSLHLKFLKDPIKLAEFVRNTLRDNDYELAQKIVDSASASTACTVSWNHIIEWQLSKGKMNAAMKSYNDMKKRAQVPDAQTYTIIFTGCANHSDSTQALEKVMIMYNSMLRENAPVRPNTIHLNAVLKMCARAGNMEAMFTVVDQMPKKGLTAPNNVTYTTIFNALCMHIDTGPLGMMTPMQRREYQQKSILHARYLWAEVIKAWRQGDLWIDEELVCSMGRILLIGNEQDIDDVLSLVEQTMNIPRQVPRRGSFEQQHLSPKTQSEEPLEPATVPRNASEPGVGPAEEAPPELITPVVFSSSVSGVYATPGQNTLSLVIQSLTELRLKEPVAKYWDIFVNNYNVVPDAENYHTYLRLLRISRSSSETVNLMMKMPTTYMQAKTFRIAMSTCVRDKKNHHSFANAGKILDFMQTALREPEIPVLERYLEVAMTSTPYTGKQNHEPTKYEQGRQVRRALERLNPSFLNLKAILLFRDPMLPSMKEFQRMAFVSNILGITRRMISAYDTLINNAMVPREDYNELTQSRSKLAAFVTRHNAAKREISGKGPNDSPKELVEEEISGPFKIIR